MSQPNKPIELIVAQKELNSSILLYNFYSRVQALFFLIQVFLLIEVF